MSQATAEKTRVVKVAFLVFDEGIYPRSNVSSSLVMKLREAIRAGVKLPPLVASRNGKLLIDGVHRSRALLEELGAEVTHEVEFRDYKDRNEMLADAVRIQDSHGLPLDQYERIAFIAKASDLGFTKESIGEILHMTIETVERYILGKTATYKLGGEYRRVALKRPMYPFAGEVISGSQVSAQPMLGGNSVHFMARQLTILLETGSVKSEHEKTVQALQTLHGALGKWLNHSKSATGKEATRLKTRGQNNGKNRRRSTEGK